MEDDAIFDWFIAAIAKNLLKKIFILAVIGCKRCKLHCRFIHRESEEAYIAMVKNCIVDKMLVIYLRDMHYQIKMLKNRLLGVQNNYWLHFLSIECKNWDHRTDLLVKSWICLKKKKNWMHKSRYSRNR